MREDNYKNSRPEPSTRKGSGPDRPAEALDLLSEARVRSTSTADLRRVLWSRFLTFTDLEEPVQAAEALKEFAKLAPESVEDKIRLSHGPIHLAVRWGG